jgi:multidrug efflux system outer membrane protein
MRLLILMLGFSVGCMVGPDYKPPELDIPENYMYEDPGAEETANMAWWHLFNDPVLDELIAIGLEYNKDIKIATANIRAANGFFIQTRAPLFPQIGYDAEATRQKLSRTTAFPPAPGFPNPNNNFQVFGTVSWQIDLWGQIRRELEAAEADFFASIEARRGVILMVVTSVANSYFQLRSLDEQLEISKRTLKSYEESLDYFEKQYKYGQVSLMTVAQARTQYETAAATIPQFESQIVALENSLSVLLGQNPESIPRGREISKIDLPPVPEGIPSEILHNRPDILQAEDNLIAANALIGAAEALYFPSISLTGYNGVVSKSLSKLFTGPSNAWNYTGSIVGPIFTWGLIYGQVEQAKAAAQAALTSYERAIQRAFADVETALFSHQMLQVQIKAQERLVEASGEYARLATLQYHGGYTPYFAVLQAQLQYFPAELALAETQAQLLTSLVNVYSSMGGGWVIIAEDMINGECNEL